MMTREQIGLVGWSLHEGTWVEAPPTSYNTELLRKEALALYDRAEKAEAELEHWKGSNLYPSTYREAVEKLRKAEAQRDTLKAEVEYLKGAVSDH